MYEFHPYFTNDGSVGLYSPEFNDIYHSATGALTEAYEKFILPINMDELLKNDSIKILDICYGIGYNSKSFLNYYFENYLKNKYKNKNYFENIFSKFSSCKNNYIDQIYTNNILVQDNRKNLVNQKTSIDTIHTNNINKNIDIKLCSTNAKYSDPIYNNNISTKLYVKAVEFDKNLIYLSPFIKTGEKNYKNQNLDFDYKKVEKYLDKKNKLSVKKVDDLINYLLFEKIIQNNPEILDNTEIFEILNTPKNKRYFSSSIRSIYNFYINNRYKATPGYNKPSFLHNIYYRYIASRYKKRLKHYNLQDIIFELKIQDARKAIIEDNNIYNLIFLDAFTPSKCPCLWSYEFFKQLYNHLDDNGMLLTYSLSPSVRGAMIEAGFSIGNIFNKRTESFTGTIAVKNKNLITHPLSEYELGLLKTTAGIFYRDSNLTDQNEAITARRNYEVKMSDRISGTKYRKQHQEAL